MRTRVGSGAKPKDIDMTIVEELYTKEGLTANAIGAILDMSHTTILRRLHEHAIPINKYGKNGHRNSHWKGGEALDGCGYTRVLRPNHLRANKHGYVLRGIVNWEKAHGMTLPEGKEPHHNDLNKLNDAAKNIEPMTHVGHAMTHASLRREAVKC